MTDSFDDVNVKSLHPLVPPQIILEEHPVSANARASVEAGRRESAAIINGDDDRLTVVVGPCSIHDPEAARDYAEKLKVLADKHKADLQIIMRVYFEKPRTNVGWKGLINDPDLNGTFKINKGLRIGRDLLLAVNEIGLPAGCEFLDTISPQFIADLVAWGAIGARTTESQVHRELASGLSCPVGFKNGTDGNIQIACDAITASKNPHHFLGVSKQGLSAIIATKGNAHCHLILRGASSGPNYSAEHITKVNEQLSKSKISGKIMIDCSHGNSQKKHTNQPIVANAVAAQVAGGDKSIIGVMIESNLVEGRQDIGDDPSKLVYGKSVTDACVSLEQTAPMLEALANAVRERRAKSSSLGKRKSS